MAKKIKKICANCKLFDHENELCAVSVMVNGQKYYMPVSPNDKCHMEELGIEIKQIRWWVENPETGEPSDKGIVKMEYPADFDLWRGFNSDNPASEFWNDTK